MEPSTYSEIHVSPEIVYAIGDCPVDDFNLAINVIVKYAYNYGENTLEEFNCENTCSCKYKSLSWDKIDEMLLGTNFPYKLERVKWINRTENILVANKDDLIKQILEYSHHNIVTYPPQEYLDEIIVNLIFVKQVSVNLREFELIKARIVAADREYFADLIWKSVHDKIMRVEQRGSSSLYEEYKCIEYFIENIVNGISVRSMCYDENYERELKESFIEQARKEFRSLPVVRSKIQFLKKVSLSKNHDDALTAEKSCSICMENYLPDSEAYNMPCNHNFHFNCIETWILKDPSCPMCRYKLPAMETSETELEV
ncbi:hypothetical protein EJD97_000297 [Solanum chilense]|uniref:RING-type domain-containing protein n=1 Tax=Solanum chilense TaxID=4083 RepID=A0A6N2C2L0_SOLCI|nr:hypothetical protein EJD97_000297 [Solanum chilense]